ncbi:hypothetical protein I6F30_35150 [Bradyrhizobium sp. NBAIM20]|nr:hypothetical protein [Bradyrhizobium sp. NBAIM20]MCA1466107.1 hypothetical protein [Bradyrhizobium sp. NBAIM18]
MTQSGSPNTTAGLGIGVGTGAVAGAVIARESGVNPLVGAVIGGIAGGVIGSAIGSVLDNYEREQLASATRQAAENAPVGQRVVWSAEKPPQDKRSVARQSPAPKPSGDARPASTASGWVIPTSEIYEASGKLCRDLQQVAVKDGRSMEQKVTACRNGSGWDIPPVG